jgi:hypothetical protein
MLVTVVVEELVAVAVAVGVVVVEVAVVSLLAKRLRHVLNCDCDLFQFVIIWFSHNECRHN